MYFCMYAMQLTCSCFTEATLKVLDTVVDRVLEDEAIFPATISLGNL